MSVAHQMPVRVDLAKKIGPRMFRKTIMRPGHISKNGVELDVDRPFMEQLIANFTAGLRESVTLQLADRLNRHNEDPERVRGRLAGLELTPDDQLVGTFETSEAGAKVLETYPYIGCSPSIDLRFERADGRQAGPTLLHVAATTDPEVSQLGEWLALSADYDQVIDLTAPAEAPHTEATTSAGPGGEVTEPEEAGPVAQLNEEELAAIRSVLPIFQKAIDEPAPPTVDKPDAPAPEVEFTDADIDAALDADDEPEPAEPELVAASADHTEALNLAKARIDAQGIELARLRNERDLERYEAEKLTLAKDYGIPQDVTELARPLLFGTGRTVELSAGKQVDAGQVIRTVLHELGRRYAKALDLGAEYGTADAIDDATRRNRELHDWVASAGAGLQGK